MDESKSIIDRVQILPAQSSEKGVLENLMHLYLYDFTEFTGDDVDEKGRFVDEYLDRYWTEPGRYPFLIKVDGKLAGFVLVRDTVRPEDGQVTHHIAEFFILRKYRRRQIGRYAAWKIFDRFPGRWHVAEIRENVPAQHFWRKVIGEYTGGKYEEITPPEWDGPIQSFTSYQKE